MRVRGQPLSTPGKDAVPIVQEAGWAPGPVWTDAENLAPTGIRSQDRPVRSQSLYQLSYPARTETYHLHVPIVLKSGNLNLLEPSGPVQGCNGIALPFCNLVPPLQSCAFTELNKVVYCLCLL
jgi:hypothetical protein